MALNIQIELFRRKVRLRKLGHFYEFGSFKGDSLILFGLIKRFMSIFNPELKKQKIFSFDSFQGLPKNNLDHNDPVWREKAFCGTLQPALSVPVAPDFSSPAKRTNFTGPTPAAK